MVSFRVVSRITHANPILILRSKYPSLKVPPNVPAYQPIAVTFAQMSHKQPAQIPAPAGLTESEFDVESPAVNRVDARGQSPARYTFTGGDIVLNVSISVFIIDKYQPIPRLFQMIMEHEFLHVADTLALANVIMPQKVNDDIALRPYWDGATWVGSTFFDRIRELWDREEEGFRRKRDTGADYEAYKRRMVPLLPRMP